MAGWLPLHDFTGEFNNVVCISLLSTVYCLLTFAFALFSTAATAISFKLFLLSTHHPPPTAPPTNPYYLLMPSICVCAFFYFFYFTFVFAISI